MSHALGHGPGTSRVRAGDGSGLQTGNRGDPGPDQRSARKAAAAAAQRDATVIGWVDGEPVGRDVLDARVAALRAGPRAAALPVPGTSEDRQFVRWTAQVLLTEELCRREAARLGLDVSAPAPLDPVAAAQLGSINTAAWQSSPAVSAVYAHVVPGKEAAAPQGARRWWRVSHAVANERDQAETATLTSIGWTTLDDLPAALADLLRDAVPGERVGPVRSPLGWHVARLDELNERPSGSAGTDGERLREYARWLDRRRAESVRLAEGFEHPGDPSQPDNTHRH